ncbi:MAG: 2-amino-4-hydroxy-6-hydroxymethyldihydropteridine diphosphokinase [Cyclobacteriaceae bacterium]|nr:2-amino-4-hydroxy-6-hydroxymethyldihydropteridine diphosphokinase [Cyclobacteriaceae bacterium]
MSEQGIYLLLGTNLGDRKKNIELAHHHLNKNGISRVKSSLLYQTAPWGRDDQPPYLNQVIEVKTVMNPEKLLSIILEIEERMGRVRIEKWGNRTIDIDILLYGDQVIDKPHLKVPHPEMVGRRFTLQPLAEIAPNMLHPVIGDTIRKLLEKCPDTLEVVPF